MKLIDVYPEDYPQDFKLGGYQLMVANDVFRGRFRKSFEKPEPLVPGAVDAVHASTCTPRATASGRAQDHGAGAEHLVPAHRPQPADLGPNIFQATAGDYRAQTHRVWRTPRYPSRVEIQTVAP